MRILTIGDPHFKPDNGHILRELQDKIDLIVSEESPDAIVVLGDVLDTHDRIKMSCLSRAAEFLFHLSDLVPTYVLVGNHDRESDRGKPGDFHSLSAFARTPNLHILDRPKALPLKKDSKDHMVFIPYYPVGEFNEVYSKIEAQMKSMGGRISVIFAHQEFAGAEYGVITSKAEAWEGKKPTIISGHIHKRHDVGNVWYVGTPYETSFSDTGILPEGKGVDIFTITPKKITRKFFSLGLPRKITMKVDASKIGEIDIEKMGSAKDEYRIEITGKVDDIKSGITPTLIHDLRIGGVKIKYSPDTPLPDAAAGAGESAPYRTRMLTSLARNKRAKGLYEKYFA